MDFETLLTYGFRIDLHYTKNRAEYSKKNIFKEFFRNSSQIYKNTIASRNQTLNLTNYTNKARLVIQISNHSDTLHA